MAVFGYRSKSHIIKHPEGHPVAVRVTFHANSKMRIDCIHIEDDLQEHYTYKVIKSYLRHEYRGVMTFDCIYEAHGMQYFITLLYDVPQHKWVLSSDP